MRGSGKHANIEARTLRCNSLSPRRSFRIPSWTYYSKRSNITHSYTVVYYKLLLHLTVYILHLHIRFVVLTTLRHLSSSKNKTLHHNSSEKIFKKVRLVLARTLGTWITVIAAQIRDQIPESGCIRKTNLLSVCRKTTGKLVLEQQHASHQLGRHAGVADHTPNPPRYPAGEQTRFSQYKLCFPAQCFFLYRCTKAGVCLLNAPL